VVIYHFTWAYSSRYPNDPAAIVDLRWGAYGVPLFFLVSGFVILMSAAAANRPSDFVISRAARLYPAYWLSLILGVAIAWMARVPDVPLSPVVIAANVTMVQRWFLVPNVLDVYWTLAVEMQFYALLFVALLITRCHITDKAVERASMAWLVVSLGVAIWALPASHNLDPQVVATPVKLALNATLAAYGPLFVTGMLAFLSRRRSKLHPMAIPSAAIAVVTTGLLQTWETAAWVGGICAVFLVVIMRQHTRVLLLAPIQWLGKVSYSLYLVHSIIGYAIIHALWPVVGLPLAILVATVVALVAAWASYELAERRVSTWARSSLLRFRDRAPRKHQDS